MLLSRLPLQQETTVNIIALGVFFVWAFSTIAGVLTKEYTGLITIQPVMLIVTGALMALRRKNGNGRNGGS